MLAAAALVIAVCVSLWRRRSEPSIPWRPARSSSLSSSSCCSACCLAGSEGGLEKALAFQTFSALAFLAPLAIVRTRPAVWLLGLIVAVGVVVGLTAEEPERSESVLVLPGADNQIQVGLLLGLGVVSIVAYLWPASKAGCGSPGCSCC